MSKPWFASFKRAAACVGVSGILALGLVANDALAAKNRKPADEAAVDPIAGLQPAAGPSLPALDPKLPERTVVLSSRGGQTLRVGDTVSYALEGGDAGAEARWGLDPRIGGLKMGFLFRAGRLFTPLMAGELTLPALPVVDEKNEIVARTAPLTIKIESNFSEKERGAGQPPKAEPALGPLELPFPVWIQSAIGFSILAFLAIGAFFLVRYLRRKAAAALKKMIPKKPYDQAALERIDALIKAGHLEKGAYKPFYFGISETLKFYFGERFDFDARESTTSELIALLKERNGTPGLNDSVIRKVEKLFESLDPVKFADQIPGTAEAKEAHRTARELITSTKKVVAEPILKEAAR